MDDFIFGTLATDELRAAHVRKLRAGVTHNHARSPRDPLPGQPITIEITVGPAYSCEQAWIYWTEDGRDPAGENGVATCGRATRLEATGGEWDTLAWGYVRHFRATLPAQPAGTVVRYRIGVGGAIRRIASTTDTEVYADDGTYYGFYVADDPPPAWAQDAIIYQIFVDRFFPGQGRSWLTPEKLSGFFGGTLRGITERLDYITDLGANVLWLTPIFPSSSHHGYDATDYFEIEPRLGSKDDLREMLDAAHARGMRVLLDFVPNHWSSQHATFQHAIAHEDSPYRPWYTFHHWPDEYETFFGVRILPQINLRNPQARAHMLDAAGSWLEFGVDGYRVDYCIGPTPDFWADFRRATRTARPDCWTFGEAVDPPDRQLAFEGGMDGCLDFMLLEAMRQTFAFGQWNAARFGNFLERHEAYFPPTFTRPSFLDNHDMNRYLWAAGGDQRRLKLAALCQFTLAGPPVIYYGTEVGLSQERDVRQGSHGIPDESRLPMLWGDEQDTGLRDFYRALIALRSAEPALRGAEPALRGGTRQNLQADETILVYARQQLESALVVAINLAQESRQVHIPGNPASLVFQTDPACAAYPTEGQTVLHLPPLSGVVLKP